MASVTVTVAPVLVQASIVTPTSAATILTVLKGQGAILASYLDGFLWGFVPAFSVGCVFFGAWCVKKMFYQ